MSTRLHLTIAPSQASCELLRQEHIQPSIGASFTDANSLYSTLARMPLLRQGLKRQPPGWLEAVIEDHLRQATGPLAKTLQQPGWTTPLARTLTRLAQHRLHLQAVVHTVNHAPLKLLAELQLAIASRRKKLHYASEEQVFEAACLGINEALPVNRVTQVNLFGDVSLSPMVFEVLTKWLSTRTVTRTLPAPFNHLKPAHYGLFSCAPQAAATVSSTGFTLQKSLFTDTSVALTDAVVFASTPDEVRECTEAVRQVLQAISDGVPLTQIAIAVPDSEQLSVLQHALERAKIPVTSLIGPPLLHSPPGRFLLSALEVSPDQRTAEQWYAFISLPGLQLRHGLGAHATEKRTRWRKLLTEHSAYKGPALIDALKHWTPREDAYDADGDKLGRDSLVFTLKALQSQLSGFVGTLSWTEFCKRCTHLLTTLWHSDVEANHVKALLHQTDPTRAPIASCVRRLTQALKNTPLLRGMLSDRAIRVARPMNLLGGTFQRVIVLGLSDGRFPRKNRPDAFLPDTIIEELNLLTGADLETSQRQEEKEQRRFASLVASCSGSLWLSSPGFDMLQDRPVLPSPFLLTALKAFGEEPTYKSLEERSVDVGSRSQLLPPSADALDLSEHRAARLSEDARSNLPWMVTHVQSRRQLLALLHQSEEGPNVYNGLIKADLNDIVGLHRPATPRQLECLLDSPERFLLRWVLGVRNARSFGRSPAPFAKRPRRWQFVKQYDVNHSQQQALQTYLEGLTEQYGGVIPTAVASLAKVVAKQDLVQMYNSLPPWTPVPPTQGLLFSSLPWKMTVTSGFIEEERWCSLVATRVTKADKQVPDALCALMLNRDWIALDPFSKPGKPISLSAFKETSEEKLKHTTVAVQRNWWPLEICP